MHKNRTDVVETDVVIFPMDSNKTSENENEHIQKKIDPKTDKVESNVNNRALAHSNSTFPKPI